MEVLLIIWYVISAILLLSNVFVVYALFNSQKRNRQVTKMNDVITTVGELNASKQFRIKDLKYNTYRGWQIRTLIDEEKNAILELQLLDEN